MLKWKFINTFPYIENVTRRCPYVISKCSHSLCRRECVLRTSGRPKWEGMGDVGYMVTATIRCCQIPICHNWSPRTKRVVIDKNLSLRSLRLIGWEQPLVNALLHITLIVFRTAITMLRVPDPTALYFYCCLLCSLASSSLFLININLALFPSKDYALLSLTASVL